MDRMDSKKTKIRSFPRDALEHAETVRIGWERVGKKLVVPNLTSARFETKLKEAQLHVEKAERLKAQRAKAIQERNLALSELWDWTKRIRNAAKATFGDNSEEFELLINLARENDGNH